MSDVEISKKSVTCPLCKTEFISTRVATPRLKLIKTDTDLRPYYKGIDTIPYEITTCEHCGYSTFYNEFILNLKADDAENISNILSKNFQPKKFPEKLSNENGIEKYKLSILVAKAHSETQKSKLSNLYMKLAWLFRNENNQEGEKYELACLKNSYQLGIEAFKEENFPVMGISKSTFSYLLGDIARRLKMYDEAKKWLRNAGSFHESTLTLKDRINEVTKMIDDELDAQMKEKLATKQSE